MCSGKKSLTNHLFINNLMQKIISVQESILTTFNLTLFSLALLKAKHVLKCFSEHELKFQMHFVALFNRLLNLQR